MKKAGTVFLFFLLNVFFMTADSAASASTDNYLWVDMSNGIPDPEIISAAVSTLSPRHIYVSGSRAAYQSLDGGRHWEEILSMGAAGNRIQSMAVAQDGIDVIYIGADDGLHRSRDGGGHWEKIFQRIGDTERSVLSIGVIPAAPGKIYIGTGDGIFISEDRGLNWIRGRNMPSGTAVSSIAINRVHPDTVFAASSRGIYRSFDSGREWGRTLKLYSPDEFMSEELPEDGTEVEEERRLPAVVIDQIDASIVYACMAEGLFLSRDSGLTWNRTGGPGPAGRIIRHIAADPAHRHRVYAATVKGVFRYSVDSGVWEELYKGLIVPDVRRLVLAEDHEHNALILWAASAKGIYKLIPKGSALEVTQDGEIEANGKQDAGSVLALFSHEPSIGDVREAAIVYAEVEPGKIMQWRRAAARRAWLPDVRVDFDRNKDWQSSTYFYSTTSQKYKDDDITNGKDRAWSISLTWELGDLVWNDAQTSIDTRSRLMVQLRDDVLSEVTRLYYERRRLQIEIAMTREDDIAQRIGNELRLQELTANIDALTGSYFSKRLGQSP